MTKGDWRSKECIFCQRPPLPSSMFCALHREQTSPAFREAEERHYRAKHEAWQRYNRKCRAKGKNK